MGLLFTAWIIGIGLYGIYYFGWQVKGELWTSKRSRQFKELSQELYAEVVVPNTNQVSMGCSFAQADQKSFRSLDQELVQRELQLNKFNAYQECPKCRHYGFWFIDSVPTPWDLLRECGDCGHKRLQRK